MKLGILVVYLFDEKKQRLVDLHLAQIESCTQAPYTIYASANRLDARFRDQLAKRRDLRICDIPTIDETGGEEHAYYLDHLSRAAVEDGCTHIVAMHLDSFPVRDAWEEELASRLDEKCAFVTLDRINTACLFFTREFFLRCNPTYRLTKDEQNSPEYRKYLATHDTFTHSGIGYAFAAFRHGLTWSYLKTKGRTPHAEHGVFDDLIFHLGGASFLENARPVKKNALRSAYAGIARTMTRAARTVLPLGVRRAIYRMFKPLIWRVIIQPQRATQAERIAEFLRDPRANPNAFAESARRVI